MLGLNGTVLNEIPGDKMLKAVRGGTHDDVLDASGSFSLMYTTMCICLFFVLYGGKEGEHVMIVG